MTIRERIAAAAGKDLEQMASEYADEVWRHIAAGLEKRGMFSDFKFLEVTIKTTAQMAYETGVRETLKAILEELQKP